MNKLIFALLLCCFIIPLTMCDGNGTCGILTRVKACQVDKPEIKPIEAEVTCTPTVTIFAEITVTPIPRTSTIEWKTISYHPRRNPYAGVYYEYSLDEWEACDVQFQRILNLLSKQGYTIKSSEYKFNNGWNSDNFIIIACKEY